MSQYITIYKYISLFKGGVNYLHGIPGILSGIVSIIMAAVASRKDYGGDR